MGCLGEIDAGAGTARDELRFQLALDTLLSKILSDGEPIPNIAGAFGGSERYSNPAFLAGDFLDVYKPTKDHLELVAALRARALKRVEHLIERLGQGS